MKRKATLLLLLLTCIVLLFGCSNKEEELETQKKAELEKQYNSVLNKSIDNLRKTNSYEAIEFIEKIEKDKVTESTKNEYKVVLGEQKVASFVSNNETFYVDDQYLYLSLYNIWHKKEVEYELPHNAISLLKSNGTIDIKEKDSTYILSLKSTNTNDLFNILKQGNNYNQLDKGKLDLVYKTIQENVTEWGYTLTIDKKTNTIKKFIFNIKHNDKTENNMKYEFTSYNQKSDLTIPEEIKINAKLIVDPVKEMKERLNQEKSSNSNNEVEVKIEESNNEKQ